MSTMATAITAAPCAKCPFRKDVPIYLRTDRRAEIAGVLVNGGSFPCHAEVDYREDEEGEPYEDAGDARMCAGAAKAMMLAGGTTNLMRVAERLGMADLDRTAERGPDVWDLTTWQRLAEGATADNPEEDEEEIPTCNTVNDDCLAPAGYGGFNGGIAYGTEPADLECSECGEPVCSNCADDEGRCGMCGDWHEDDEPAVGDASQQEEGAVA